jgi:hypothetical protein
MRRVTKEAQPANASERRHRLSKLFRVLVVGGAVLAAANAVRLDGNVGTAAPDGGEDGGGGGTPGW